MPYNTRRKSLSLPSLGIHLPVSQASRAAAAAEKRATSDATAAKAALIKSQTATAPSTPSAKTSMSPPSLPFTAIKDNASANPKTPSNLKYEHTPPPSPEAEEQFEEDSKRIEIDLEGINDDIVEAVIIQLQKTANRPHLVKELAAILGTQVKIVET